MSGPSAESGHAPEPAAAPDWASDTTKALTEATRHLARRGVPTAIGGPALALLQELFDAGVIVAGPAVTGRIEETQ